MGDTLGQLGCHVDLYGLLDASGELDFGHAERKFVLALGNRPKGEKGLYIMTLWYDRFRDQLTPGCTPFSPPILSHAR